MSDEKSSTNLLPCPFCGGNNLTVYNDGVWCEGCSANHSTNDTDTNKDKAIAAWNKRAAVELNLSWLPLDSAPRDGTAILVLLPGSDIPIAARYYERTGWRSTWDDYHLGGADYPTHWMHIPNPKKL